MSISISGSTAISGLGGMDTNFDTVLEQLYTVEQSHLNQLEAWKSDWQLRYDAFNTVIDQMSAAKQMLSNIGSVNHFVTKNAASTNESVLTAIATGSAANGQHKIIVNQMASNAIWCNTGAVFESKTDIINKTDHVVDFTFDYAGKTHTFKIAANTTLESFVSLINNSSENPGVQVSLINTRNGYVFQIAGKDTGETNSLTIYNCELEGMNSANATSLWESDTTYNINDVVNSASNYKYTVTLDSGTTVSFNIKGDATDRDLVLALNNAAGADLINADIDASGNLVVAGVKSITRTTADDTPYVPASYKLSSGNLSTAMVDGSTDTLNVSVKLSNGLDATGTETFVTREFSIAASATRQEFINQINQALNSQAKVALEENGSYAVKFSNVAAIDIAGVDTAGQPVTYTLNDLGLSESTVDASGTAPTLPTSISAAQTTLTFDTSKLADRIDGKEASADAIKLTYTFVKKDGTAIYVNQDANGDDLKSDLTNQQLLQAIKDKLTQEGISFTGDTELTIDDIKEVYLSQGSVSKSGFTNDYNLTTQIDASSFYSTTDSNGNQIRTLETPPDLTYKIVLNDDTVIEETFSAGHTLDQITTQLASRLAGTNAQISWVDSEGNAYDPSSGEPAYLQVTNIQSFTGTGIFGQVISSSNWSITNSSNAIYQVDNWPMAMESESNTINDLMDGVSLTIQGTGEANLTISTDIASVETSIQNFLDAVNSVLLTIRDLTAVDENKEKTSNDPDDIGNSNYSKSTLTSEIGGLLTGNYGVQLVKSRFTSLVTSTPPGFQSMTSADDLLSGDLLSCLSNLGIKTDTDSTSDTYGLLVIAPQSDYLRELDNQNYEDMINNHINELVDFFVSEGTGTSTSPDFRYNSHIQSITEAGTYDVKYSVDANGRITNVTIGGEQCQRDESRGGYYFTCASGAARGLAISIDDLTEGDHTGQIRIKQGLVQTVEKFLEKELKFNDINITANASADIIDAQISMKSENGAMMTLKSNYATIMENIDKSISKEQRRLDTWYNRQKNIFSNLETLMRELNSQQESLESQLKQLSND